MENKRGLISVDEQEKFRVIACPGYKYPMDASICYKHPETGEKCQFNQGEGEIDITPKQKSPAILCGFAQYRRVTIVYGGPE